jgi:hypothetical protein
MRICKAGYQLVRFCLLDVEATEGIAWILAGFAKAFRLQLEARIYVAKKG